MTGLPVIPWEHRPEGSVQAQVTWREAAVPEPPDIEALAADAQASLGGGD